VVVVVVNLVVALLTAPLVGLVEVEQVLIQEALRVRVGQETPHQHPHLKVTTVEAD
jgi:hypothetical protein